MQKTLFWIIFLKIETEYGIMCVLCAYISRETQAAPLLLESGERIQGLWSGFYTGIGILGDDGVIRHRKTTGYSRYWRERFSTDELPGRMGFFHSRTNSGGDARYAHPFVSSDGSVMLCGQGYSGIFDKDDEKAVAIGNMLLDEGVVFSSRDDSLKFKKYQILKDGSQVHISDIVTEYAAFLIKRNHDPLKTVQQTGSEILEEAISLYIFRDFPGRVYTTNVNTRLAILWREDGVIMSSSPLAFGNSEGTPMELPPNTVSEISVDGIKIEKLTSKISVHQLSDRTALTDEVLEWIKAHPGTKLAELKDNILNRRCKEFGRELYVARPHFIMEQLLSEGKIYLSSKEVPGPVCCSDLGLQTLIYPQS